MVKTTSKSLKSGDKNIILIINDGVRYTHQRRSLKSESTLGILLIESVEANMRPRIRIRDKIVG